MQQHRIKETTIRHNKKQSKPPAKYSSVKKNEVPEVDLT